MSHITDMLEYLLANPIYLAPILLLVATMVFALLKKLLKLGVIVAIAAGLYLLLMQYMGGGF